MMPIIGREGQLRDLAVVAGLHSEHLRPTGCTYSLREPAPPLVVVFGGISTGKSLCVAHALQHHADLHVMVDCTAIVTARMFYREILGGLMRQRGIRTSINQDNLMKDHEDDGIIILDVPEVQPDPLESVLGGGEENQRPRKNSRRLAKRKRPKSSVHSLDDGNDGEGTTIEMDRPMYRSLNFLSFVKALCMFMNSTLQPDMIQSRQKRVLYIALDHMEMLFERGFERLLHCLLGINDHLDHLHMLDENGAPWTLCVILITRAVSLTMDLFMHNSHPAFIHFPSYTKDEIAEIISTQLLQTNNNLSEEVNAITLTINREPEREKDNILVNQETRQETIHLFRKWIVYMYDLLPHVHNDWIEFRHIIIQFLPSVHIWFDTLGITHQGEDFILPQLETTTETILKSKATWQQLQSVSHKLVTNYQTTRRKHLFGYDTNIRQHQGTTMTTGDPMLFLVDTKLSRDCLLLVLAGYLASFTPNESDFSLLQSAAGTKQKKKAKKAAVAKEQNKTGATGIGATSGKHSKMHSDKHKMHQLLIGPTMFSLSRLLAIYASLQKDSNTHYQESDETLDMHYQQISISTNTQTRADVFTHLAQLTRLGLFQKTSPPNELDALTYRCLADTNLVEVIAKDLQFPLDTYLGTKTS